MRYARRGEIIFALLLAGADWDGCTQGGQRWRLPGGIVEVPDEEHVDVELLPRGLRPQPTRERRICPICNRARGD
jgi:hypothetical protein